MTSGAKRGGSSAVIGLKPPTKEFGISREFQCKTYLPAERHIRLFLEEVAHTGSLQLAYKASWLLARFWKTILPLAAARLTPAMRQDLKAWVPGSTIESAPPLESSQPAPRRPSCHDPC